MIGKNDELAAGLLEQLGNLAGAVGPVFGAEGAAAGLAAKAVTYAAAEAIRKRGVTADQLVASLRKIDPLDMPWPKGSKKS